MATIYDTDIRVTRTVTLPKTLDNVLIDISQALQVAPEQLASRVLHSLLELLHTINYDRLREGYQQMSDINLDYSD